MNTRKKGEAAEKYTKKHYEALGYKFVASNYYCRYGEIDLIMKNDEYIAFVEVKARDKNMLYSPAQAVTKKKQEKIKITAQVYLCEKSCQLQPRFDISEVFYNDNRIESIDIIENAFM